MGDPYESFRPGQLIEPGIPNVWGRCDSVVSGSYYGSMNGDGVFERYYITTSGGRSGASWNATYYGVYFKSKRASSLFLGADTAPTTYQDITAKSVSVARFLKAF